MVQHGATPEVSHAPLRGITYKLASVLVFIVMSSMIKATADHVPAGQAVFFRSPSPFR
jgi:hypothetical protein